MRRKGEVLDAPQGRSLDAPQGRSFRFAARAKNARLFRVASLKFFAEQGEIKALATCFNIGKGAVKIAAVPRIGNVATARRII